MTRALLFLAALVAALAVLAPSALAGTWLPAESLRATNTKNSHPAVAVSANGDAAAIWARNDASGSGAYTSLRQGGDGAWGNPHLSAFACVASRARCVRVPSLMTRSVRCARRARS